MAISALLNDIQNAMKASLADGNGQGSWKIEKDSISVTTQFSKDPSRSSNGGEYSYWRDYKLVEGGVLAKDDWSCDFADYENYGGTTEFYPIAISDLSRVGYLAEARALAAWNEQAEPVCPFCGGSLEEVFKKLEGDDELRETVVMFLKRKVGFEELRQAVNG